MRRAAGSRSVSPRPGKRSLEARAADNQETADDAERGRRRMAEALKECLPMLALCGPGGTTEETLAIMDSDEIPEVQ